MECHACSHESPRTIRSVWQALRDRTWPRMAPACGLMHFPGDEGVKGGVVHPLAANLWVLTRDTVWNEQQNTVIVGLSHHRP